ncbi:MAG: efflux RND transporter permease subunit [Acidobacteria bacterium]|nr:efflux RND transporter permease subunit [Acidobacteriota bacterium]
MKIIDLSLKKPVTITMFITAVVVFGMFSIGRLPINLLPDISYPTLTIRTDYPGAAPAEVENLVSRPIEEAVGAVTNLQRVSSVSRPEQSDVVLEFDWETDMDMASLEVREKLDLIQLPDTTSKPVLLKFDPSLDPIMRVGVYGESDRIKLRILTENKIKRDIERLEGIASVEVSGGLVEEIHVMIDTEKLASLGLSLTQIATRLAAENIDLAGGKLEDGDTEYLVRTLNRFMSLQDISDIVITIKNGAPVLLKDISKVSRGYEDRKRITQIDGRENVELAIYKEAQANTVTLSTQIKDLLSDLEDTLNKRTKQPIKMEIIEDQARFIHRSVSEVKDAAIIGGLLAVFILFLFLRSFRSTMIIGIAIPISVVITFFLMYIFKISLNIMSLGGLTLGIGMLVDNAIVVLEAIHRYKEKGIGPIEAAKKGASEVAEAVTASTLTTVFVFVPIVFVTGIAGQLFRDQALTVAFSLTASLIVALTLIPMLSSLTKERWAVEAEEEVKKPFFLRVWIEFLMLKIFRFIKNIVGLISKALLFVLNPILDVFDKGFNWLTRVYPPLLKAAIKRPGRVILTAVIAFLISYLLYTTLGGELIPEMYQGQFYADLRFPAGTPIEKVDGELQKLVKEFKGIENLDRIYTIAGSTSKTGGTKDEQRENLGQLVVFLKEGSTENDESVVMEAMRSRFSKYPGLEHEFGRPAFFSFKTPIEVYIKGRNLLILDRLSRHLKNRMDKIEGLVDIRSSMESGNPEIQIRFDRVKLATIGTDLATVASLIRTKVLGDVASEFIRTDRKIDIRIRAEEKYRKNIKNLENLNIAPTGGKPIPLKSVADIQIARGPMEIRRVSQERTALITANLDDTDLASAASAITKEIEAMNMPETYFAEIGGQRKEMDSSFSSMRFAIFLAIFLVYLVMASNFESLLHPFVIMFTIPFGLIGVVLFLFIFNITVNIVVLIGVIMLAGIVVNNAIVLVDYTNQLRAEGMSKNDALVEAAQVRLRPILMTTATTILGLLPMAISLSEGSELRIPMAITVIGGLLVGTMLTLIMIPTVYSLLDRKK